MRNNRNRAKMIDIIGKTNAKIKKQHIQKNFRRMFVMENFWLNTERQIAKNDRSD